MREEVKTITKVVLNENEIESIKNIASISCIGIHCCNCPFNDEVNKCCVISIIRHMCDDNGISYRRE